MTQSTVDIPVKDKTESVKKVPLDIENYLNEYFVAKENQKLKICSLWGSDRKKYFRLNMYTHTKRENSIMDSICITESWFVIVTIDEGRLSHVIDFDKKLKL